MSLGNVEKAKESHKVPGNDEQNKESVKQADAELTDMQTLKRQIESIEQDISNEEGGIPELSAALSQEIKGLYTLHEEEYRQHLVEQNKDSGELEDLSRKFSDAVSEIFNSDTETKAREYSDSARCAYEAWLSELDL